MSALLPADKARNGTAIFFSEIEVGGGRKGDVGLTQLLTTTWLQDLLQQVMVRVLHEQPGCPSGSLRFRRSRISNKATTRWLCWQQLASPTVS